MIELTRAILQIVLCICLFLFGLSIGSVTSFKKLVVTILCIMIIDLRNGVGWASLSFWAGMLLGIWINDELEKEGKK